MRCIYIFVCVCALTFLSACIEQQDSRLESALNMAGANKGELLKVLNRDRKSTRLNSSHIEESRMPSSA